MATEHSKFQDFAVRFGIVLLKGVCRLPLPTVLVLVLGWAR